MIKELKDLWTDFWRYMDTTCPPGVNREKYTQLKYSNRDKLDKICEVEPLLDKWLVVNLAIKSYVERDVDTIFEEARWYYGERKTRQSEAQVEKAKGQKSR